MKNILGTPRIVKLVLALMFMLMPLSAQAVAAQNANPDAMSGVDCTTVLGVGAEGDACVSVVHASPDAPNVDIYVNGDAAVTNLAFGWWTEWVALPAGEHQVQVTATGAAIDTAVIDATLTLEAGKAYQVAATGFVAEIAPQVYEIDLSNMAADSARVQVMHAVPDAPAVDIALTGGDVLIPGLEFPMASDILDVPAGSYDLEVRIGGTEDVALPLPGVELSANTLYQVYAIGSAEAGTIAPFVIATELASPMASPEASMMAATDCATILGIGGEADACVNIIHASPDAPNVDVWVNGAPALTDVPFQAFSGWMALPAGEYHVQVTPTGAAVDTAVIDTMLTIEAGTAYHVAAVGDVANISAAVIEADLSATTDGGARIRVIHASPDAPNVDIALTGGDVLISDLAFGSASDYLEVPAGSYDLEVRVAGTTDVALPLPGVALEGNMLYDVIAVGTLADGTLNVLVIPSMTSHGE